MSYLHPTQNSLALQQYEHMGEIAYVAERKRQAMDFIRADYGRFAWISFKRFVYYWAGRPRSSEMSALVDNSAFLASSILAFWGLGRAFANASLVRGLFLAHTFAIPPSTTSFIRIRGIAIPLSR